MTAIDITRVGTVFVPVSDQERALAFFRDTLGFELRVDFIYGSGTRWLELGPAGSGNTISLVGPDEGERTPSDRALCAFATSDATAAHAALLAAGAEVDAEVAGAGSSRPGLSALDLAIPDPVPAQFSFRDPDGNRFLLVQPD